MDFDVLTPEFPQAAALDAKGPSRWQVEQRAVVRITSVLDASPERIFDAWLDPAIAGNWLFAMAFRPMNRVTIDARVGGAFCFVDRNGGEHTGVYVEIVRPRRLVFTLSMENDPKARTRVTIEIVPRDGGSELILTHKNLPPDHADSTENRWTGILYGLGVTLNSRSGRDDSSRRKSNGRSR